VEIFFYYLDKLDCEIGYKIYFCNHYNFIIVTRLDIPTHLYKKDIKPSYQRIKIFEYLYHEMNHPTADVIFKNLVNDIPTLSKTTVYNTLKIVC